HHAPTAGVQLGRRRLRLDRGNQGPRPGHRGVAAPGHRSPRHLRLGKGREEGACADRLGAEVDRGASRRPLRDADRGASRHGVRRWSPPDDTPWLWWPGPAAAATKAHRQAVSADAPARRVERMMSEAMSAALDYYRDTRDAMSEAAFFLTYGSLFSLYLADKREADERASGAAVPMDPRELPFVKEALASLEQGGYAEALARIGAL